jgi:glycosidase
MTGAQDPDNRRMFPDPAKLTPAEKSVQDHVSKLNALRTKHPAIRYGSRRAVKAGQDQYAVVRAYLQDRVLVLYNRSEKAARLQLNVAPEISNGPLRDQLGTLQEVTVKNGFLEVNLPARSVSYLTP